MIELLALFSVMTPPLSVRLKQLEHKASTTSSLHWTTRYDWKANA